ncbi:hypothetical protein QWT69_13765 [Sporosarcina oncorhynchi]|uniref:YcdB/YcdC repeated domain-containing protein n=1 Tax=Sporosarcina oncorhynchi TaxID=3056444 RepID=A0ABZ0L321_9BACL|nr:YcdB/YcdC domain-containing protein [Sporosarcina sp. T2O-4]WOV86926.1 hypothetical protein QWT69_13765 [Sporosarcina sp. T2O-4]
MKKTLNTMAAWLKMPVTFEPSIFDFDHAEEDEVFYIKEEGAEEPFAVCSVDDAGRLKRFDYIDAEEYGGSGDLKAEDIPPVAEAFIQMFHPDELKTYRLQSVIDLEGLYLIQYGIKEERYNLDLPGIGFSLTITAGGRIMQFSFEEGPANIVYPEQLIAEEEAEAAYIACTDFELEFHKTDTELFRNGDNTYRLVWSLKEAAVDIPASGEKADTVAEGNVYEPFPPHTSEGNSFLQMVGVTDEHVKIGERLDEGLRVEKWQHDSLPAPVSVDYETAYESGMITIHYDSSERPVFVYNGEAWAGNEENLDEEILQQRALNYLFGLFPDAEKRFKLEQVEQEDEWEELQNVVDELIDEFDELNEEADEYVDGYWTDDEVDADDWLDEVKEWLDDEEEVEGEEAKEFYFQYHVNGVPVDSIKVAVQVGIYSGRIVSASMEMTEEFPPADVSTVPVLTKAEAAERMKRQLKMELAWSMEFDEEGETFYRLTYVPSFPLTFGHVRMIDAVDGTAYYMDVGGSIFF